jgi:hypothetical protein
MRYIHANYKDVEGVVRNIKAKKLMTAYIHEE